MAILRINNINFLIVLLFSFIFFNPAVSDSETDALIDRVCRATVDFGFCYKTFHENLKSPSTDLIGLARISIDQGSINATNGLAYVNNLYQHEKDSYKKYLLQHCVYGYQGAVDSFHSASMFLDARDFPMLLSVLLRGPEEMRQCNSLFAMSPDIGERNIMLKNLMTMAVITAVDLVYPDK
ncbi:hypothetical protein ACFE04_005303 [Oxalis oulophora]